MAEIKRLSTELQVKNKLLDTSGDAGTSGQILSSTGTGTNWINAGTFSGGTVANATTFNGDIIANTHIYGRYVNNSYSKLYRFGGLYLTWDSDSYGTAFEHSLTSSYGGTFNDSITLNSYNHIRFNIDSNNNNSTSYFEVGDGTTGTSNVIFRIDQAGDVTITGDSTTSGDFTIADNKALMLGTGGDAFFKHTGSAFSFFNDTGHVTFTQRVTDGNIIFKSDNMLGGETEYFRLDGAAGETIFSRNTQHLDSVYAQFGTGDDLKIYHESDHSRIYNETGDLIIRNNADNARIRFQCDNGSGGYTTYFDLQGSQANGTRVYTNWYDNSVITLGNGLDTQLYHDSTDTIFYHQTGDLYFKQAADNKDIIFENDDGSGNLIQYFRIDGDTLDVRFSKPILLFDNVNLKIGAGQDLELRHDATDSYIQNSTGHLYIYELANDKDIIFKGNDGGSTITALTLDMSLAGEAKFNNNIRVPGEINLAGSTTYSIDLQDHSGYAWLRNEPGQWSFQSGTSGDDWTQSWQIYVPNVGSDGGNATFVELGQRHTNDTTGEFKGVKIVKRTGSGVVDGDFQAGATTVSDLTVTGDLNITGDINSYSVTDLDIADKTITVGVGQDSGHSGGSGILISRSDAADPSMLWNQTDSRFDFNSGLNVTGQIHTTGAVYAKGALYVKDTDGTNNHIQARSNGTEGFLTVSNGSNWGLIMRGPSNDPRIGAYYGGTLKIEGFHSSDGATGANAIDFAQFQFGNDHFLVNAASNRFTGLVGIKTPSSYTANTSADDLVVGSGSGNQGITIYSGDTSSGSIYFADDLDEEGANDSPAGNRDGVIQYSHNNSEFNFKTGGNQQALELKNTSATFTGNIELASSKRIRWGAGDAQIEEGSTANYSLDFSTYDGSNMTKALTLLSNNNATFTGNVTVGHDLKMPTNGEIDWNSGDVKLIGTSDDIKLQGGSLSITGDGSNPVTLTESGSGDFTIDAPDDIRLDAGGGDIVLRKAGTEYARLTHNNPGLHITTSETNASIYLTPNGTGNVYASTDTFIVSAYEGETAKILLRTDESDDNGDDWYITNETNNNLEFTNDKTGSQLANLTLTPQGPSNSAVANFAGNVTVTNNLTAGGADNSFDTGNNGTFVTKDTNNYPRITVQSASAQLGLFRSNNNVGGMYIGGASDGFRIWTEGFSPKFHLDQSGNADFSGNVILNSRLTFDYGGDHYIEAGTNSLAFKNSSGSSTLVLGFADQGATFYGTLNAPDGSATTPSYNFTSHDGNGIYLEEYDASNNKEQVSIATDGTRRVRVNEAGLWSDYNVYFAGSLRKFGEWQATSGTAGEGFKFQNTADSTTPLTITSTGNATFAGQVLCDTNTTTPTSGDAAFYKSSAGAVLSGYQAILETGSAGSRATALTINNSQNATFAGSVSLADNKEIKFGDSGDFNLKHDGSNSKLENYTGHLNIIQEAADKDIVFQCDDGSGGITNYIQIDGSELRTTFNKTIRLNDSVQLQIGSSNDAYITHNGTNTYFVNGVGNLEITNDTNDGDIIFKSDDGSGGTATYFYLDGGNTRVQFNKDARFVDNAKVMLGTSDDLKIYHDGTHSRIVDAGTGHLVVNATDFVVNNSADTKNMIIATDGGSVNLYYNGTQHFRTVSAGVEVTGVVTNRNIPCIINTGWGDDSSTTSNLMVPLGNTVDDVSTGAKDGEHTFVAPYAGKLVKIIMKNTNGSLSSSFTTELKYYKNGSSTATSGELTPSSNAITWAPTSSNTFVAGDEINIVYQKSAGSKYWREVSMTIVIELTDYDI